MVEQVFLEDKCHQMIIEEPKISKEAKWYSVDKEMIPAKAVYFFLGAERSSVLPYIAIFLTSVGLSVEETGTVLSFSYVGITAGNLFWGLVADRTRAYKTILIILCFVSGAVNLATPFISAKVGMKELNQCPLKSNKTYTAQAGKTSGYVSSTQLTYVMSILLFFGSFFGGSIFTFVDAAVIEKTKTSTRKANFGRQLLFVAVGFGSATTVSGKVLGVFPKANVSCYLAVYSVSVGFLFCGCISSQYLYRGVQMPTKQVIGNIKTDLWKTLKKLDVILFLLTILVSSIMYSVYLNYFFLFLKQQLKSPDIIIGLTVATGSISGVVALFFTSWFIKVLRGTFYAMLLTILLMSCRFLAFSYLKNPWLIIPLQLVLHGCSLSLFLSVKSEHLKIITPKNILSTMFGITSSLSSGISMIIGSKIGGSLYQAYGARNLFLITSVFGFLWSLVLALYLASIKYQERKNTTSEELCVEKLLQNIDQKL